MKKIYISVMASLLLFASCSDYLDVNSPSTFDKEYVFGSESEIATAVNGMYVPMVSGKGWVGRCCLILIFSSVYYLQHPISMSVHLFRVQAI